MGRSDSCNKEPVTKYLKQFSKNKSISVLDLGVGEGDFGAIVKKVLPQARLTGVEVWKKYEHSQWALYDTLHMMDIRKYLQKRRNKRDVILLIDVIEHFNRQDGLKVLKRLQKMTNQSLLISTPITNYPQGKYLGNPYEEHKHFWSDKELEELGFKEIFRKRVYTWQKKPRFATLGIFVYESKR
ncbi:MAG TPA: class I SAM-dependent methyltransferase [Candidatus Woesearchaeota archaeon]|nr:class I SAM-dependent methyltransferase [Candidatus Woesearchaeota archaeon]